MFVPRSARRVRFARMAFVLGVLLPSAALVAWAVHRQSTAHCEAVRVAWEQAVGLPLGVAAVEHPLPGVVRARDCTLAAAGGRPALAAGTVRVETSSAEVRISVDAIDCDPAAAAVLAGLAGDWLGRGARFRRDVVIDVAEFAWSVPGAGGRPERRPLGAVRIECVVKGSDRAVRIVRRGGDRDGDDDRDDDRDEARLVWVGDDGAGGDRLELEASSADPLPFPILAAVAGGGPVAELSLGRAAAVRGRLSAVFRDRSWSGRATGRIDGIDLASSTAARAVGTMDVVVGGIEWRDGRLTAAELACDAVAGRIDRRLLESLVSTLGCRAGPAYVGAAIENERPFDAAGCTVRVDGRGIALAGSERLGGALAVAAGRSLLDPPAGILPPERLAWLLAPSGAVSVPASGPGAWLMSILPRERAAAERTSRAGSPPGGGF